MATIDLIILGIVALGAFNGYKRGLIIELFGILGFFITLFLGYKFLHSGTNLFADFLGSEKLKTISPYLSFFAVLALSGFMLKRIGWLLRKAVRLTFLGIFDSIFGAIFGGGVALFGLSLMLFIMQKIGIHFPDKWILDNQFLKQTETFAPSVFTYLGKLLPDFDLPKIIRNAKK